MCPKILLDVLETFARQKERIKLTFPQMKTKVFKMPPPFGMCTSETPCNHLSFGEGWSENIWVLFFIDAFVFV